MSCRFSAPLPSGQEVTGRPRVVEATAELATVELEALSESGERVLGRASLTLQPN